MHRDNKCMCMAHVYICCSVCVGVCGNGCCVAAVVENSIFEPWSVEVCVVCL